VKRTSPRSSPGCPSNAGGILFIRWSPRRQIQERGWFLPPWASVREPSQHRSLLDHSARKTTFPRRQRTYPAKTSALPHSRMMPIAPARLLGPASRLAASRRNSTISSAGINRTVNAIPTGTMIKSSRYPSTRCLRPFGMQGPHRHRTFTRASASRGDSRTQQSPKFSTGYTATPRSKTAGSPPHAGDIG